MAARETARGAVRLAGARRVHGRARGGAASSCSAARFRTTGTSCTRSRPSPRTRSALAGPRPLERDAPRGRLDRALDDPTTASVVARRSRPATRRPRRPRRRAPARASPSSARLVEQRDDERLAARRCHLELQPPVADHHERWRGVREDAGPRARGGGSSARPSPCPAWRTRVTTSAPRTGWPSRVSAIEKAFSTAARFGVTRTWTL